MNNNKAEQNAMRIGALADAAGVHVETIRYYQRCGLLRTPSKAPSGIRRYSEDDLARLRFIRRAKALGFSLRDIHLLLQLDEQNCDEVREIAKRKLAQVRERMLGLESVAKALETMILQCETSDQLACPIINSLARVCSDLKSKP